MATTSTPGLVSIVLVNKDCGAFVDVVFPSIDAQTYPQVEIVVVDNGSADGSLVQIRRRAAGARIVELGRNAGFSGALNAGVRASRGEYVLSLNFDVVLEPSFVAELVRALQERSDIGWVAGAMRQLGPHGPIDAIDCNGHYLLRSRYCYGCDPNRPEPAAYEARAEVFGASACAALYRRDMLEHLALDGEIFDEDLFAYFEDIDVDWRAQRAGYRCLFVPAAKGAHMRGGTGLSKRPEVAALALSNRFLVMAKNDDARDVLRDLGPIVRRTLVDIRSHVRRGRGRALVLAAGRIVRLAPKMWRKRRRIRKIDGAQESPVRRFRIQSDFLG
jgi:GT2 family glycosyltransferase